MSHLTPDEFVDAVEGTLAPARQPHVVECSACRDEVERLDAVLWEARVVEIPEPSPLFWDRFSARVREAIADEPPPRQGWAPAWLRWPVLLPLGAIALLVLSLVIAIPRSPAPPDLTAHTGPSDEPAAIDLTSGPAGSDAEWAVVSELVGPLDLDDAQELGIGLGPGAAERAALELNAEEQQELVRLLREEIQRPGI